MGHHIGDNDSFGASIGFYRITQTIGKKAHIVIEDISGSVIPIAQMFHESDIYAEDMFISGSEAVSK